LKLISEINDAEGYERDLSGSGYSALAEGNSCGNGNEPSGFIRAAEYPT
jgi:hypothetical protein